MKKIIIPVVVIATLLTCACNKLLDIVPDNVSTLDNAFTMRTSAERFLHSCYASLPNFANLGGDPAKFSSGELECLEVNASNNSIKAWYIPRGFQSASSPYCDFWCGTNGGKRLFHGIRNCNILIKRVTDVWDMEDEEKLRWIDEAKFLKAYYHFYLTRMYGPIPIVDVNKEINASIDEVHVYRNTLDECFDYIINLLDEIIEDGGLPDVLDAEASELGRITNGIVKAFKAQVCIYAASPLFNGNTDYKGYADNRGVEIFCPNKTEEEKAARWKAAVIACKEAIEFLEKCNYKLYEYSSNEYSISEPTKYILSRRCGFNLPDNFENIWYFTNASANQMLYFPFRFTGGTTSASPSDGGTMCVPIQIASLYYTKNGLPIDQDITWDFDAKYEMRKSTSADKLYLKPDYSTAKFHYDRENRFYSDLAFDGASWFGNNVTTEGSVYWMPRGGQLNAYAIPTGGNVTGYCPRKLVNYKTINTGTSFTNSNYHFPILSMRQLYLYYAEALNECGADWKEVLPYIDKVRARSGVPDVATSWDKYSYSPGLYKEKNGLRSIIHREQMIEMMFEGQMAWDVRRWKEAMTSFNRVITGWDYTASEDGKYFTELVHYQQKFEAKDYFWPINSNEIYSNNNLIQNPGW